MSRIQPGQPVGFAERTLKRTLLATLNMLLAELQGEGAGSPPVTEFDLRRTHLGFAAPPFGTPQQEYLHSCGARCSALCLGLDHLYRPEELTRADA